MKHFSLLLPLTLLLAACAPSQISTALPTSQPVNQAPAETTPLSPTEPVASWEADADSSTELTRLDGQGAVIVEVTPLDLAPTAETLEFDVAMNTHSVDLSMDLAALATLATDTGVTIQAAKWDAIPGGHHVEGKLIFPTTQDDKANLEGASKLTLTIINLDAPSRVFEWELN